MKPDNYQQREDTANDVAGIVEFKLLIIHEHSKSYIV